MPNNNLHDFTGTMLTTQDPSEQASNPAKTLGGNSGYLFLPIELHPNDRLHRGGRTELVCSQSDVIEGFSDSSDTLVNGLSIDTENSDVVDVAKISQWSSNTHTKITCLISDPSTGRKQLRGQETLRVHGLCEIHTPGKTRW